MAKVIKKHRHLRLLGKVTDGHLNKIPREYRGEDMLGRLVRNGHDEEVTKLRLVAAKLALEGQPGFLLSLLDGRQKDLVMSYLNKENK